MLEGTSDPFKAIRVDNIPFRFLAMISCACRVWLFYGVLVAVHHAIDS